MKKRILAMLLVVALVAMIFCGCSGSNNTASAEPKATGGSNAEAAAPAADEPPAHIVLELLTFDAVPRDLEAVEAAINEISIPEANVEIELYPLGFMEATQQVGLMISSGDQLDLILSPGRADLLSLVNKNMLLELGDLLDQYGQGIKEAAPNAIPGGYVDNELYGIPSIEHYGSTYGIVICKDIVDAVGWEKFDDLTIEELGQFLALAKEKTDKHLIHLSGGGNSVNNFDNLYVVDYLGADIACGGIVGVGEGEGDQIVNIFATEEYAEFCRIMYEWNRAGYFNTDCATNTDSGQAAVTAGTGASYFLPTQLEMVGSQSAANGVEMVALNTKGHYLTTNDIAQATWSIPYTCENPEAAMRFMNLMWTNRDIVNLLYYGIEGLNYQKMDDGSGRITYMDGESAQTTGYREWFGWYGNTPLRHVWSDSPADLAEQLIAFNADVSDANRSRFFGYAFNPDTVKTQYAAVNDVISTYRTSLECGAVNPDEVLPKFLSALEAAGINEIIAANQSALDAWVAAQ